MSDVDPTPETPTTVGDRMAWWRGDINAQIAGVRGGEVNSLAQIASRLAQLRGEPASDLAALAGQLASVNSRLTSIEAQWAHGSGITPYNLLDLIYQQQVGIQARLDLVQAALGAAPYNDLEVASIRGLLYAILTNAQAFGIAPDGISNATTTDTHTINGKRYIIWPSISGLNRAGDETIPLGGIILPVTNWDGYQVYIKTDAPTAFSNSVEYPVNSWISLTGSAAHSFWVDAQYSAIGYMRVPETAGVVTATAILINEPPENWFAQWTSLSNTSSYNSTPNIFVSASPLGWNFRNMSTGQVKLFVYGFGGAISTYDFGSSWFSPNVGGSSFWVFRAKTGGTFTIQAVPPGGILPT